jgi:hypothetical protein
MSARLALIALLLPLLSWTPDFSRSDWLVALMAQPCASIRIAPRDLSIAVLCDGARVEALRASTTSGLPYAARARRVWSAMSARPRDFMGVVTVSIGGDFVVIEAERCPTCNVQRGAAWVFRPHYVRPATMRAIQLEAGLGAAPLRTTLDAWRAR